MPGQEVKVDQWVAVFCNESEFPDPNIRKIIEVKSTQIRVAWYIGKWSGQWTEWLIPASHPKRKQPWEQWVDNNAILSYDFAMTATNHLHK